MAKESGKSSNTPSFRSALNNGQEARLLREKLLLTSQVRDLKLLETSVFESLEEQELRARLWFELGKFTMDDCATLLDKMKFGKATKDEFRGDPGLSLVLGASVHAETMAIQVPQRSDQRKFDPLPAPRALGHQL